MPATHVHKHAFLALYKIHFVVVSLRIGVGRCEGHRVFPLTPSPLATSELLEVLSLCFPVL